MKTKSHLRPLLLAAAGVQLLASSCLLAQTSWNFDGNGNWSDTAKWTPSTVPDGAGTTVNFTNNITTSARTITINDASRTVGIINIGDSNNTHRFIIARTSPYTLTLNNGGSDAQINETGTLAGTNYDTINVPVVLASNLAVNAAGDFQFLAGVSESGGSKTITKTGAGNLRLTQNNTYTGVTNVNAGSALISNNGALGTTAGNTIVASGATVYGVAPLSALAEAFNISGTGVGGNGALRIGGGGTTNISGAVTLGADARIQTDGGVTLTFTGGIDTAGHTVTLASNAAAFNVDTVGITGAGSISKNNAGPVTFNAANSHTGSTTLNQGTITVGATGALSGSTATLAVNNTNSTAAGTNVVLNLTTGADTTVGSLSGTIATPTSGTNTATINTQTGRTFTVNQTTNGTYEGVIAGAGDFTLGSLSTNTLTLTGTNTYTGATNIEAGTLRLNGSTHASSAVTVGASGTLAGNGTVGGSMTVNGVVAPGQAGESIQTLNAGSTTWNAGNAWEFDLSETNNTSDKLAIAGNFTKGTGSGWSFDFMGAQPIWNTTFTLVSWTGTDFDVADFDAVASRGTLGAGSYSTSYFQITGNTLTFTAIPEPSTAIGGLLLTAGLLRRRRKVEG